MALADHTGAEAVSSAWSAKLARKALHPKTVRDRCDTSFVFKTFIGNGLGKLAGGLAQSLLNRAPIRKMAAKSAIARAGVCAIGRFRPTRIFPTGQFSLDWAIWPTGHCDSPRLTAFDFRPSILVLLLARI
jgi:hypothetical protein